MSLAKNVIKNAGKNISKNLGGKYNQKLLAEQCATASKREIQKTPEVIGDFTSNKSVDRITKVLTQLKIDKRQIKIAC